MSDAMSDDTTAKPCTDHPTPFSPWHLLYMLDLPIDRPLAQALAHRTGNSVQFWLTLQDEYEKWQNLQPDALDTP